MEQKLLPVAKCYESETNPRGTKFEGPSFNELVASIKEKGVLQPVLARPRKHGGKEFEIVAGNRRFRASTVAGLTELPAIVKDMTDDEAREAQIIENLQRSDIHPLEEGEAYRQLIEQSKFDVKAVAVHVGKSESYVRDRLLLTGLIPAAKKMLRAGNKITAGHASLIARLDSRGQKEALEYCDYYNAPDISDLREWIRNREYADASNAPWKNDEAMKLALGGCEECEGKGGDLFGKKAADACTNPKCYARRMAAYIAIKLKESPDLLVPLSAKYGTSGTEGSLSRGQYEEVTSKKSCGFEGKGIITEGEGLGRIIRYCAAAECKKHGDNHSVGYQMTPEEKAKQKTERKKEREAADKKQAKENEAFLSALDKIKLPLSENHLLALFDFALHRCGASYQQSVCKLFGLETVKVTEKYGSHRSYSETLRKFAGDDKVKQLRVIFALLMPQNPNYPDFKNAQKKL